MIFVFCRLYCAIHSMAFLRTVHTKWNKRWHVWNEWHFRKKKSYTRFFLRNQKKIERFFFFSDCRIRYTQIVFLFIYRSAELLIFAFSILFFYVAREWKLGTKLISDRLECFAMHIWQATSQMPFILIWDMRGEKNGRIPRDKKKIVNV